jgi:hypothetical protein
LGTLCVVAPGIVTPGTVAPGTVFGVVDAVFTAAILLFALPILLLLDLGAKRLVLLLGLLQRLGQLLDLALHGLQCLLVGIRSVVSIVGHASRFSYHARKNSSPNRVLDFPQTAPTDEAVSRVHSH